MLFVAYFVPTFLLVFQAQWAKNKAQSLPWRKKSKLTVGMLRNGLLLFFRTSLDRRKITEVLKNNRRSGYARPPDIRKIPKLAA